MSNSFIAAPVAPVIDDPDLDEEGLTDEDLQDEEEEEASSFYDDDDDDEYGYGRRSRRRYLRWLDDDGSMSAYERNL